MFVVGITGLTLASQPTAPQEGILKSGSQMNPSVLARAFVVEETKNQVLASNLHQPNKAGSPEK